MGLTNFPNGVTSFGVPLLGSGPIFTTGNVFFVDSGAAAGTGADDTAHGTSPTKPFSTVDFAVGQCTANNADYIVAMPGHNENFSALDSADIDVAGVTVLGVGTGTDVPTFDYDNTAGEFVIGAANVTLENLRMRPSTNAVVNAINVEAAGDRFTIRNCRFGDPETSTDEFADMIIVEAGADEGVIEGNVFSADAQAAVAAIELNGAVIGITIRNNTFVGDYSTACIRGDTTLSQKVIIENNLMWNGDPLAGGLNAQPAIELLTGTIGVIRNNDISCAVASAELSIVADGCFILGNTFQRDEAVGIGGSDASMVRTIVAHAVGVNTTPVALFTVTGGTIHVLSVVGTVVTAIQAQATTQTLECLVTSPSATVAMSTAVETNGDAVGTVYHFLGEGGVLTPVTAGLVFLPLDDAADGTDKPTQWFVPTGTIQVDGSAISTGDVDWVMTYVANDAATVRVA